MKRKIRNSKSQLQFEVKEVKEEGSFEGLLSPYGNVDDGGDVVEPGAYTKTLKERGAVVPMLWSHKADTPIGNLALEDRKDGLWCKGQLFLDMSAARDAYAYLKNTKVPTGLSIGFETVKDSIEKGVRHLKEIKLFEGSVVLFPMNKDALIWQVKNAAESKGDFAEELSEIQTLNGLGQMFDALRSAVYSVVWGDMTDEEKAAAQQTITMQFDEALSEFFPSYLATLSEVYGETWAAKLNLEKKEGRELSAANLEKMGTVRDHLKNAHEIMSSLCEGKAGAATLQTKAAEEPEPGNSHSAITASIEEIEALLK